MMRPDNATSILGAAGPEAGTLILRADRSPRGVVASRTGGFDVPAFLPVRGLFCLACTNSIPDDTNRIRRDITAFADSSPRGVVRAEREGSKPVRTEDD